VEENLLATYLGLSYDMSLFPSIGKNL